MTSTGGSILDLFADDAQVYFPKWGIAERQGRDRHMLRRHRRHAEVDHTPLFASFNWIFSGGDIVVCEGTSARRAPGRRLAGGRARDWAAGRWCDVFEIRDWKIQRCFIYLDPDYAGKDTARYPWLDRPGSA